MDSHGVLLEDERDVTAEVGGTARLHELVQRVGVHRLVERFEIERVGVRNVGHRCHDEFADGLVGRRVVVDVVALRSSVRVVVSGFVRVSHGITESR
nr:hypothetical protein [Halorussus sp. DT80]